MSRYAITERAGSFVATHRNTGVGTVLDLTERQGNTFQSLHDAGRIRGTLWLQRQHASSLGAWLASAGGRDAGLSGRHPACAEGGSEGSAGQLRQAARR